MQDKDWDRIANDYYSEILSPLKDSDTNPLCENIKNCKGNVIDLGCGIGPLLPILSKQFSFVTAVDFSKEMLKKAKKNNSGQNINYFQADLRDLSGLKKKYDVAISVNSILAPDPKQVTTIVTEIYSLLKKGGQLFAIIPSMEVYIYQAMLLRQKHPGKQADEKYLNPKEFDLIKGTITFDGDTQKCFYNFEIPHFFGKAGFKNIKINKVKYSWKEFSKAGQHYFPNAKRPWDWYVSCEK